MIKILSDNIIKFLADQEVIDKNNDKEIAIYHYGVEISIASIVNMLLIVLLGVITDTLVDCILFLLVFIPVRQCTGGYHAETYTACNLVLAITYLSVIFGMAWLPNTWVICCMLWLVSFVIVWLYAPCENKHKKISEAKRKRFKWICRIIWLSIGTVFLMPEALERVKMNVILTMSVISALIVVDIILKKKEEKIHG